MWPMSLGRDRSETVLIPFSIPLFLFGFILRRRVSWEHCSRSSAAVRWYDAGMKLTYSRRELLGHLLMAAGVGFMFGHLADGLCKWTFTAIYLATIVTSFLLTYPEIRRRAREAVQSNRSASA